MNCFDNARSCLKWLAIDTQSKDILVYPWMYFHSTKLINGCQVLSTVNVEWFEARWFPTGSRRGLLPLLHPKGGPPDEPFEVLALVP